MSRRDQDLDDRGRWREQTPPAAAEATLAALFRAEADQEATGLDGAALARIEARLLRPRRHRLSLRLRLALTSGALLLGLSGAGAAVAHLSGWRPFAAAARPAPRGALTHGQGRASSGKASVPVPVDPSTPETLAVAPVRAETAPPPAPVAAPVAPPPAGANRRLAIASRPFAAAPGSPRPRAPQVVPATLEPRPAAGSALAGESALLSEALAQLRRAHDGQAALATLDRYAALHPHGVLAPEAARARADALFLLGERAQSRRLLESLALETRGRDLELMVVRGELRAADDCAGAERDFTAVLAARAPAALSVRALVGRAGCRALRGDASGAAADRAAARAPVKGAPQDL